MKQLRYKAKAMLRNSLLLKLKRAWSTHFESPTITQAWFPPITQQVTSTLLVCVEPNFNQNIRNAAYLTPLGFIQGWTEVAGGAKFIPVKRLLKEIDKHDRPVIFISQLSLRHFSFHDVRQLRGADMFVWVHIHPRAFGQFERENPLVPQEESDLYYEAYAKLIVAEPRFVWNSIGSEGMRWFHGWKEDGFRWETIFPGANNALYYPDPSDAFRHVKIGYVGGYWGEKAQAFDAYFRPLENHFFPYGYSHWPYKNYGGGLSEADERRLYSTAGLIPLVTSPAGWSIAEITERYLKAPACKAFCIADQNPAIREIFDENEMLQASSGQHFHHLVNEFLKGRIDIESWRERGYQAILKKHLVKHRTIQLLNALKEPSSNNVEG